MRSAIVSALVASALVVAPTAAIAAQSADALSLRNAPRCRRARAPR